jgi:hypothetical protein
MRLRLEVTGGRDAVECSMGIGARAVAQCLAVSSSTGSGGEDGQQVSNGT